MSSELQTKVKTVQAKYLEAKNCENKQKQKCVLQDLVKLCVEIEDLIGKEKVSQENERRKKQLSEIKNKAINVLSSLNSSRASKQDEIQASGIELRPIEIAKGKKQKSRQIARVIISEDLTSKNQQYSEDQLERLVVKMENNLGIMEEIESMLHEQKEDVEAVKANIKKSYEVMAENNKELKEAVDIQTESRLRKIRLGLTGILGAIGWGILGIPGMIVGMIAGLRSAS